MTPEEILFNARCTALAQACHDDKGQMPTPDTLRKAMAYYQFLMGIGLDQPTKGQNIFA